MPTTNGVQWDDFLEGYSENFAPEQQTVTQYAQLKGSKGYPSASDVKNFKIGILGDVKVAGGALVRTPPATCPRYPWLYGVACELAKTDGAPRYAEDGVAIYPQMVYRVTWRNLPYDPVSDPLATYLERQYDSSHEAVQTGPPAYQWALGTSIPGEPVLTSGQLVMGLESLAYTWHDVPVSATYEAEIISSFPGFINSVGFDPLTVGGAAMTYPLRTLLFMSAKREPYRFSTSGTKITNYTFLMSYRINRWDFAFNRRSGIFERIVQRGTNLPPYKEADFKKLFSWAP